MNTETRSKSSLSQDLTVVLIRGNGSPRSFRVPLPALQRSVLLLSLVLTTSIAAALLFFGLNILRVDSSSFRASKILSPPPASTPTLPSNSEPSPQVPIAPIPATTTATPAESTENKSGLWDKLTNAATQLKPTTSPAERDQEMEGLREDIAKLNAKLEDRKEVPANQENVSLLQFMGPKSALIPASESTMKVEGIKVVKDPAGKEVYLDFELHNVDPSQKPSRGYIIAVAKTADVIAVYPSSAFSPTQNILLNFTKGETFGVSRFRQARATFNLAAFNGKKPSFQIILFGTDGRVLSSIQVEDSK